MHSLLLVLLVLMLLLVVVLLLLVVVVARCYLTRIWSLAGESSVWRRFISSRDYGRLHLSRHVGGK